MSQPRHESAYAAYLLRCWHDDNVWRYSLERVDGGRRHGFANLEELVAFLRMRASEESRKEGWVHKVDDVSHSPVDRGNGPT